MSDFYNCRFRICWSFVVNFIVDKHEVLAVDINQKKIDLVNQKISP